MFWFNLYKCFIYRVYLYESMGFDVFGNLGEKYFVKFLSYIWFV